MPRRWRKKIKKTRHSSSRKPKKGYKKKSVGKYKLDLGYKKEAYVVNLINKLRPQYEWLIKAKQSAPNGKEDIYGIDISVITTHGKFYLQIKGTLNAARKFMQCDNHGRHFKTMYIIASENRENNFSRRMFSANSDALPFITVLVIYNNGRGKIEDEEKVLQKIKIALDIIKRHFD